MKKMILALLVMASSVSAALPQGSFILQKIQCSNGEDLKLGGKFMQYDVRFDISDAEIKMTAIAKSAKWAPFKLDCTQINLGKYSLIDDNKYEGFLAVDSVECNAKAWESILRKQLFGVEEQGVFTYSVNGDELRVFNEQTVTPYSCKKTGSYPIYIYKKN
ncbi:hypothetical protein [Bacteriovorax sp. Seq25_V]|uniref:hypothetical protein n=1 Tax=Bacteriovorax sp. Seq25_V TaxID=1201288 RepID=UPI00038A18C8|nr:hypothetical protein [Bacteriovorax sp. Seq25_V]EQC48016.1 hypothetical protein M900_A0088 [Bacteriovorax sp. Seq25_V]